MTDLNNLSYAAQITISLPGAGEAITMTVTLWPADAVDVDGVLKPLGECTLADLERYAQELEADVWETYDSILLTELEADEDIEIEIKLTDDEGATAEDWQQYRLILPLPLHTQEETDADLLEIDDHLDEEPMDQGPDLPFVVDELSGDVEEKEDAVADEQEVEAPDVAVAEPEQVYPEIEEAVGDEVQVPAIIPSRARVRVAGKRLPINDPTWAAVDILIDEPALRQAQAHALSSLDREVAGVLLGSRPEKQPDGRYLVHIFDTIVARHTVMQGASVTYTPESWRYLNDTLTERYPDDTAVMVGWYHTHPGFGIFLSGMDLFIHQNFFTQIWHVALVLDPRARTCGFFCWDRPKARVDRCNFAWPTWAADSW